MDIKASVLPPLEPPCCVTMRRRGGKLCVGAGCIWRLFKQCCGLRGMRTETASFPLGTCPLHHLTLLGTLSYICRLTYWNLTRVRPSSIPLSACPGGDGNHGSYSQEPAEQEAGLLEGGRATSEMQRWLPKPWWPSSNKLLENRRRRRKNCSLTKKKVRLHE